MRNWYYPATRLAWAAGWLALAVAVWLFAVPQQLERGCWMAEWPFEEGCDDYPSKNSPNADAAVYSNYLARNVGDVIAWNQYAARLWADGDDRLTTLMPKALALTPNRPMLLWVEVDVAAKAQEWERLTTALVKLADRGDGDAYKPLMGLMAQPNTQELLLKQLTPDTQWLNQMLRQPNLPIAPADLLPFVEEGLRLDILKPATVQALVDQLIKLGQPVDAYMLWLTLKGKVSEGLFNKTFDQRSTQHGFDWQWPQANSNALVGARVSQVPAAPRAGQMLEVDMNGRAALPPVLASQLLVLLQDRYKLTIHVATERLKTRDGLVWGLYCTNGKERWAETEPIKHTQGKWVEMDMTFAVPAECGGVVQLKLEPKEAWEIKAGMTGLVHFDDFDLQPLDSN